MKFGEIVKRERLKRRWRQGDLGKLIGRSQTNISDIEKGEMPKFDIACLIGKVFDITPTELWDNIKNEYEIKEIKQPPQEGEEGGRLEKGGL